MFLTAGTFDGSFIPQLNTDEEEVEENYIGMKVDKEEDDEEAFNYVAGYVGRKLGYDPAVDTNSNSWISIVGGEKFHHPSEDVKTMCRNCNTQFNEFHGYSLRLCNDPVTKLQKLIHKNYPTIPPKLSRLFCKVKFYSRLRRLNSKIKSSSQTKSVRAMKQVAQL